MKYILLTLGIFALAACKQENSARIAPLPASIPRPAAGYFPDTAVLNGDLEALKRRDADLEALFMSDTLSPETVKALLAERLKILPKIGARIQERVGSLSIDGVALSPDFEYACEYGDPFCTDLDGGPFELEGNQMYVSTKSLLGWKENGNDYDSLFDASNFPLVIDKDGAFDSPMPLSVPKPDGLDYFRARAGVFTNGGFDHMPPNGTVVEAVKGNHVFFGVIFFDGYYPEIPECLETFKRSEDSTAAYNACYASHLNTDALGAKLRDQIRVISGELARLTVEPFRKP